MLREIAKYNSASYPRLKEQIEKIEAESREVTGVGLYVNFKECQIDGLDVQQNATLSSNQVLMTSKLKNGLGFIVDIKNGFMNYLEIFTFDEEWDGRVDDYYFESIS